MRRSLTCIAILLAVFQLAAATNVQVLFDQNHTCNVSANFNHEDNVIIRVTLLSLNNSNHSNTTNSSSVPTLEFVHLAGFHSDINSSMLLPEMNSTNTTRTYKFKYWNARFESKACIQQNHTLTCRFRLKTTVTDEQTDLYISMQSPDFDYPLVKIVGSGYNNVTWDKETIDTHEVAQTQNFTGDIHLVLLPSNSSDVRLFAWNASNFNASWMMSSLRPEFVGIYCGEEGTNYTNGSYARSLSVVSRWTGDSGFYYRTPLNLSSAGIDVNVNTTYICNVSVLCTERHNNHSLIPIKVENRVWIEAGSNHSNHSNSTNSTNSTVKVDKNVIFRTRGQNYEYHLNAAINRSNSEDMIITFYGFGSSNTTNTSTNSSAPVLHLVGLAGEHIDHNVSSILSFVHKSNASVVYRFRYVNVPRHNSPCVFARDSLTCGFNVYVPILRQDTTLYISIDDISRNYTSITIVGAGFNNETSNRYLIDTWEDQITQNLYSALSYKFTNQSSEEIKLMQMSVSGVYASGIASTVLRPKYIGFHCADLNGSHFHVNSVWRGGEGVYYQTPLNLSAYPLPLYKSFRCNTTLIFTENGTCHSLLPFNMTNGFFFNESRYHPNDTNSSNSSNTSSSASSSWVYIQHQHQHHNINNQSQEVELRAGKNHSHSSNNTQNHSHPSFHMFFRRPHDIHSEENMNAVQLGMLENAIRLNMRRASQRLYQQ